MKPRITIETAILVTKYAVSPITCSLPKRGSNTWMVQRNELLFWVLTANLGVLIAASLYNVYIYKDDLVRIIKIMSEIGALTSTVVKMMICRIQGPQIQDLLDDLEIFLKRATQPERDVIHSYVDRCFLPHTIVFGCVIVGPIMFICAPLITSQPLPADAAWPFDIEPTWITATLYFLQSVCIVGVGSMVIVDMLFAIILWYAGARFQVLSADLQSAATVKDVTRCARAHQELLRYTDRMKAVTKVIAMEVNLTTVIGIIAGGFVLTRNPSAFDIAKYAGYEIASVMEIFLFAWPADNLMEQSAEMVNAAYNCEWIGKSEEMLEDILIVMQRSQKPNVIAITGLLPALSLESCASTMTAAFSYLTTLRAMAD